MTRWRTVNNRARREARRQAFGTFFIRAMHSHASRMMSLEYRTFSKYVLAAEAAARVYEETQYRKAFQELIRSGVLKLPAGVDPSSVSFRTMPFVDPVRDPGDDIFFGSLPCEALSRPEAREE